MIPKYPHQQAWSKLELGCTLPELRFNVDLALKVLPKTILLDSVGTASPGKVRFHLQFHTTEEEYHASYTQGGWMAPAIHLQSDDPQKLFFLLCVWHFLGAEAMREYDG